MPIHRILGFSHGYQAMVDGAELAVHRGCNHGRCNRSWRRACCDRLDQRQAPALGPAWKQQDIAGIIKVCQVIVGQLTVQIYHVVDAGLLHLTLQLDEIVFIGIVVRHQIKAVRLQQQLCGRVIAKSLGISVQ